MRVTLQLVSRALILALVCLGVGCVTSVDVVFDKREDFSRYATWSWQPDTDPTIEVPDGNHAALEASISRIVEQEFAARGFAKESAARASLLVSYDFDLERKSQLVEVPFAPYLLASNSSSGSYWIEGTKTEMRTFQDLRLVIQFSNLDGKVVWRGSFNRRLTSYATLPLEEAVSALLANFPPNRP